MTNNNHLYSTKESRYDTLFGDISFLGKLRRARDEFEQTHAYEVGTFIAWMQNTYGVEIKQNENGMTADARVLDPQKYLIFELKFAI